MIKIKSISINQFLKKYHLKLLNPFNPDIFTPTDLEKIREDFGIIGIGKKISTTSSLLSILIKEPFRIIREFPKIVKSHLSGIFQYYHDRKNPLISTYPFSDYALKTTIIASFKPKRLLEIGTARGWGITAFKTVLPHCDCYTMSPKNTLGANNELPTKEIGRVFKDKKMAIKQIWSNSLTFNYKSFNPVDVTYIDGNHKYKYVYSDLVNCSQITKKVVIVDDYIPAPNSPRGPILKWGWWNADVVKAVKDYLIKYPNNFKEAYWLENTPICLLIK